MVQDLRSDSYKNFAKKKSSNRRGFNYFSSQGGTGAAAGDVLISEGSKEERSTSNIIYSSGGTKAIPITPPPPPPPQPPSEAVKDLFAGKISVEEYKNRVSSPPSQAVKDVFAGRISPQEYSRGVRYADVPISGGVAQKLARESPTPQSIRADKEVSYTATGTIVKRQPRPQSTDYILKFEQEKKKLEEEKNKPSEEAELYLGTLGLKMKDYLKKKIAQKPSGVLPLTTKSAMVGSTIVATTGVGAVNTYLYRPIKSTLEDNSRLSNPEYLASEEGQKALRRKKFESENLFNLMIAGGTLIPGEAPSFRTKRVSLSASETAKVKTEFDLFIKERGIKEGSIITQDDALAIQKFFLKYNREGVKTDVVPRSFTGLVKSKVSGRSGSQSVGVELSLKPLEEIKIIGKETPYEGSVGSVRYMIVKKGKSELVNPKDIPNFEAIELKGTQKIGSRNSFVGKDVPSNLIERKPGTIKTYTYRYTDEPLTMGYYDYEKNEIGLSSLYKNNDSTIYHELAHAKDFNSGLQLGDFTRTAFSKKEYKLIKSQYSPVYPAGFIPQEIFADLVSLKKSGFKITRPSQQLLLNILGRKKIEGMGVVDIGVNFVNEQLRYKPEFALSTNLGDVSTFKQDSSSVVRPVNDVVSSSSFQEQLGLSGAKISRKDFVGRISSVDLSGAKIFKAESFRLKPGVKAGSPSVFEETNLNIRGLSSKETGFKEGSNLLRLTRKAKSKTARTGIEDLRFRLEYIDKKQLVARNIREVTEFDSSFRVKLYTYDDKARIFKNVEVIIPKPKGSDNILKKIISPANINNKAPDSGSVSFSSTSGGGSGQASVLIGGEIKTEQVTDSKSNIASVNVKAESKSESKAKTKTKSSGGGDFGERKVYEGTKSEQPSNVYYEGVNRQQSKGTGSMSRFGLVMNTGTLSRSSTKSGTKAGTKTIPKIDTDIKIISDIKTGTDSLTKTDTKIKSDTDYKLDTQYKFDNSYKPSYDDRRKSRNREPEPRLPKFPGLPIFRKESRKVFGVSVRRGGEFRTIVPTGLNLQKAIKTGRGFVENTSAATFRILKSGKPFQINNPSSSYYTKGTSIIERPSRRIKSSGELREITLKGIRSQRKKNSIVGGIF